MTSSKMADKIEKNGAALRVLISDLLNPPDIYYTLGYIDSSTDPEQSHLM